MDCSSARDPVFRAFGARISSSADVENNPTNAADPLGLEILPTGPPVEFGPVPTGDAHFAVQVTPEDQAYRANNPAVKLHPLNDGSENQYFTISGQSTGPASRN